MYAVVATERRFPFGKNWRQFLRNLNAARIEEAERSLRTMLDIADLSGKRFLDVGCGSGLFSLAARRLGATVRSFDVDADSVACTLEVKRRYFPDDDSWVIEQASVLDPAYLSRLGQFDVVYAWGVLHHTGAMWQAMELLLPLVRPGGKLYLAIYNDQGRASRWWRAVKRRYNLSSPPVRWALVAIAFAFFWGPVIARDALRGRPLEKWRTYGKARGMSPWTDLIDWVGGYPFEVAKPEEIFDFCFRRGFILTRLKTCGGGIGCNEFVFAEIAKT